jgi:hypothetical protein
LVAGTGAKLTQNAGLRSQIGGSPADQAGVAIRLPITDALDALASPTGESQCPETWEASSGSLAGLIVTSCSASTPPSSNTQVSSLAKRADWSSQPKSKAPVAEPGNQPQVGGQGIAELTRLLTRTRLLARNAQALALVRRWRNEDRGYDESAWPEIERALEESRESSSSRSLFKR